MLEQFWYSSDIDSYCESFSLTNVKTVLEKYDYSCMILITEKNFSLFTAISHILGSSMLVKVQFIFSINDAVVIGIHHLEEVLRLPISDLQPGDLLNCMLELTLDKVKGQKRIYYFCKMSTFSILLLKT